MFVWRPAFIAEVSQSYKPVECHSHNSAYQQPLHDYEQCVWHQNLQINLLLLMNKYETLETIGEGEYGLVLKALNKETNELGTRIANIVAIKKFKEDDSQPDNKRVILREVKILKSLNHENIIELKQAFKKQTISIFDLSLVFHYFRKGKIYLICEYVERNLLEILQETPLRAQRVKNFAWQLLKGIAYMHGENIVHRDIKPENLLISKSDQVKICDLGFARSIPNNGKMTDYVATRWYRPPELLIGKEDYDKSIDIWSIGCVMAEMINGEPLFGGENDLDQLYLIQKCLGPLVPAHKEFFLKNPKFVGMKFPEIHGGESIERRYNGKVDKLGLDLLKRMLRMDPQSRITAEQALNHPYFNRMEPAVEKEGKRSAVMEGRGIKNSEQREDRDKPEGVQKSRIHINNYLQERGLKNSSKDEKIGINKVTGFSKAPPKFSNPTIEEVQTPWVFSGKGKSVGKKPNPCLRQKQYLNQKLSKGLLSKKIRNQQDEYAQEWQQLDTHEEQRRNWILQKSERRAYNESRQQKSMQNKKKKKLFKKDNVNIVFNQNTFNLNFSEDPHGH